MGAALGIRTDWDDLNHAVVAMAELGARPPVEDLPFQSLGVSDDRRFCWVRHDVLELLAAVFGPLDQDRPETLFVDSHSPDPLHTKPKGGIQWLDVTLLGRFVCWQDFPKFLQESFHEISGNQNSQLFLLITFHDCFAEKSFKIFLLDIFHMFLAVTISRSFCWKIFTVFSWQDVTVLVLKWMDLLRHDLDHIWKLIALDQPFHLLDDVEGALVHLHSGPLRAARLGAEQVVQAGYFGLLGFAWQLALPTPKKSKCQIQPFEDQ